MCVRACVRACVRVCVCVRACVRALRMCVRSCVCACNYIYTSKYVRIFYETTCKRNSCESMIFDEVLFD